MLTKRIKLCHLSVSQFRLSFTKVYKMSPQKFILKLRIQIACRQLSHTDIEISSLAQDCGFCDQSYFSRQFKSHIGLTPLQYRIQYTVD
ncbi:MAG: helix-turn-helix domain-containing protein [Akkermansiaceae bacterium]